MPTTERLEIPLVEDTNTLSKELWNNGFQRIDTTCVGYQDLGLYDNITFDPTTAQAVIPVPNLTKMKVIQVIPHDPSNTDQWKAIALASLQIYVNEESQLVLKALGILPTITIQLRILGWY